MPLNDGIITAKQIKTSVGTWEISLSASYSSWVNLVDFCFIPKQNTTPQNCIRFWHSGYEPYSTSQNHTICAYADSNGLWKGTYRYISASEQMIEVYRNDKGKIVGIHVTEKENSNSIKILDENEKEIPLILETMDFQTHPHLFKDKQCIEVASKLHEILHR